MSKFWRKVLSFLGLVKKEVPIVERVILDMEDSKAILDKIKTASGAIVNSSTRINKDPVQQAAERAMRQTLDTAKEAVILQSIDAIKKISKS